MSTGNEMVTRIAANLADRVDGDIGGRTVTDVVQDELYLCLVHLCKKYNIAEYQREATLEIANTGYQYDIPTTDSDGNTIRIKNFVSVLLQEDGDEVWHELIGMTMKRRTTVIPTVNSDHQSRPAYYVIRANRLEFAPYPDQDYDVNCIVNVWPAALTDLAAELDIGEEWDEVIENRVTSKCFSKLQQTDDARQWMGLYKDARKETVQLMRDRPDLDFTQFLNGPIVSQPWNDPMVRSIRHGYNF